MTQNEIDQMVQFLKANPEESWNPLYDAIEEFANQTKKPPISGFKGMEFIWVPPGRFTMGHPILNFYPDDDSDDEHEVVLTKGYYLSKYPITVAQYFFVTNSGASRRIKVPDDLGDFAVRNVNFLAAQEFCEIMSGIYVKNIFRLPTEAEWEYACRANMPIVTDSDEIAFLSIMFMLSIGVALSISCAMANQYRREQDKIPDYLTVDKTREVITSTGAVRYYIKTHAKDNSVHGFDLGEVNPCTAPQVNDVISIKIKPNTRKLVVNKIAE